MVRRQLGQIKIRCDLLVHQLVYVTLNLVTEEIIPY